jgi:regulator of replication initiation timing
VRGAFLDLVLSVNKKTVEELMMKKKSAWEEIFEDLGFTKEWEARGEDRAEARTAAEREQFRQEIERLRQGNEQLMQENEQLRARLGA